VVIGPNITTFALAAAPIYNQAKMLSSTWSVDRLPSQVDPLRVSPPFTISAAFTKALVDYTADVLKAKSVAIISANGALDRQAVEDFKKAITARGLALTGAESPDRRRGQRHDAAIAQFAPVAIPMCYSAGQHRPDGGNYRQGHAGNRLEGAHRRHTAALQTNTWLKLAGPVFSGRDHPRADVCRVYRLPRRFRSGNRRSQTHGGAERRSSRPTSTSWTTRPARSVRRHPDPESGHRGDQGRWTGRR